MNRSKTLYLILTKSIIHEVITSKSFPIYQIRESFFNHSNFICASFYHSKLPKPQNKLFYKILLLKFTTRQIKRILNL